MSLEQDLGSDDQRTRRHACARGASEMADGALTGAVMADI